MKRRQGRFGTAIAVSALLALCAGSGSCGSQLPDRFDAAGTGGGGAGGAAGMGASAGLGGAAGTGGGGGEAVCPSPPTVCVGDAVWGCHPPFGEWAQREVCTGDFPRCEPSTGACACVEGATRCGGGVTPMRCNATGSFESLPSCTGVEICADGACGTSCNGTQTYYPCIDMTHARSCVDGTITLVTCGVGYICAAGQCVPNAT